MNTTTLAAPVDLAQLTPEQKKELKNQLLLEQARENAALKQERANYKKMASEAVAVVFPVLKAASQCLTDAKQYAYDNLNTLISLKAEVYGREQDQQTHTFTNEEGTVSITIGHRIVDGWDDTCNTGISKVSDFLNNLGANKDKDTKRLISTIHRLLSKDGQGNLKANRVLELKKIAEEFNNSELTDAIKIISDSYQPKKTRRFVSCYFRDNNGVQVLLPLNITDADINDPQPTPYADTEH